MFCNNVSLSFKRYFLFWYKKEKVGNILWVQSNDRILTPLETNLLVSAFVLRNRKEM